MRIRSFLTWLAIVALTGCVYRMDVPQGNRIEPELITQLEIGMSKEQVEFLLGTPAIIDPYRPDHWYYIVFHKTGADGSILQRRLALIFASNLLVEMEGSLNPT